MNLGTDVTNFLQQWLHLFREQSTAGWLVLFMAATGILLCLQYYVFSIAPAMASLSRARRTLASVTFVAASDSLSAFAEREGQLDAAISRIAGKSAAGRRIRLAWRRRMAALKAGMPRGEDSVLRPAAVLGPNPRWLGTAADAFIGVGLVFTFMGLVAALGSAADTIAASPEASQTALLGLLSAASVKFFTSIAGIGGAVFMRVWQAFWLSRVGGYCARLSDAIDMHLYDA